MICRLVKNQHVGPETSAQTFVIHTLAKDTRSGKCFTLSDNHWAKSCRSSTLLSAIAQKSDKVSQVEVGPLLQQRHWAQAGRGIRMDVTEGLEPRRLLICQGHSTTICCKFQTGQSDGNGYISGNTPVWLGNKLNRSKQQEDPCLMTHFFQVMTAKATRDFCPPDRVTIGRVASSPDTPYEPRCWRYSSSRRPTEERGQKTSAKKHATKYCNKTEVMSPRNVKCQLDTNTVCVVLIGSTAQIQWAAKSWKLVLTALQCHGIPHAAPLPPEVGRILTAFGRKFCVTTGLNSEQTAWPQFYLPPLVQTSPGNFSLKRSSEDTCISRESTWCWLK